METSDKVSARIAAQTMAKRSPDYVVEVRRLLDAALVVIERNGTSARARVADIVATAGLSNDAFYRHFASKDALVAALVEDGAVRLAGFQQHQTMAQASAFKGVKWQFLGPKNVSGRCTDVAVVAPRGKSYTMYVATASGGLWKTDNEATTWQPVFQEGPATTIGDVAVAPSNPAIVWLGTGEANIYRSSQAGIGAYKSSDGGKTWTHVGLADTHTIGRIVIHPANPDVVYVAASGHEWTANAERGVFKTTDGGRSWQRVLGVNDQTGAIDLVMDPADADTLYAATWQRTRLKWNDPRTFPGMLSDRGPMWEAATAICLLQAGVDIARIAYKGSALAGNAVAGGEVHMVFSSAILLSHVRAGRLRVLVERLNTRPLVRLGRELARLEPYLPPGTGAGGVIRIEPVTLKGAFKEGHLKSIFKVSGSGLALTSAGFSAHGAVLAGEAAWDGKNITLTGRLSVEEGLIKGKPLDSFSTGYSFTPGSLTLTGISLKAGEIAAYTGPLSINYSGGSARAVLTGLNASYGKDAGIKDVQLKATATLPAGGRKLKADGSFGLPSGEAWGISLSGFSGSFGYADGAAGLEVAGHAAGNPVTISAGASIPSGGGLKNPYLSGKLSITRADSMNPLLVKRGLKLSLKEGSLTAEFSARGEDLDRMAGSAHVKADAVGLDMDGKPLVRDLAFELRPAYDKGSLNLPESVVSFGGSFKLAVSGKAAGGELLRYAIDYSKCLFCALCTEPCPTHALTMSHDYDHALYFRQKLVYEFVDPKHPIPTHKKKRQEMGFFIEEEGGE